MANKKITVILKGGLGNQMFQYAFGKALAKKSNAALVLDTISGFKRDKIYKRRFGLNIFNIPALVTIKRSISLFYLFELILEKIKTTSRNIIPRFYGLYIKDTGTPFIENVLNVPADSNDILVDGAWQNEKYFAEIEQELYRTFAIQQNFNAYTSLAKQLSANNAVAICIRLFEEMPGSDKLGVGGFTGFDFYTRAAEIFCREISGVHFFVFATTSTSLKDKIVLSGQVTYLTGDEGFSDEALSLWLLSHCRNQVIANSSFFWWGAWLAEKKNSSAKIIASQLFPNQETVPERWRTEWKNIYHE